DPPLDRGVPPPAVDLGPAGDARLHLVAKHVSRHATPELFDEARPLRSGADQAHLAAQHVEELGQLVEAPAPEEPAQPGATRIVRRGPYRAGLRLGIDAHRPEFQHAKAPAVDA